MADTAEHQPYLRLCAQGLRLVAVLPAEVNQLRRPVCGQFVFVVLAAGVDKHFQHILPVGRVIAGRIGCHKPLADDDGRVEPCALQGLRIDLRPQIVAAVVGQWFSPLQRGPCCVDDREVSVSQPFNHHQRTVRAADGLLQHLLVDGHHLIVRQPFLARSPSTAQNGQHSYYTYIYVPESFHIFILVRKTMQRYTKYFNSRFTNYVPRNKGNRGKVFAESFSTCKVEKFLGLKLG